ncbi:MAG: hypothetical protein HY751_04755 [Nitrospinae bacterium]|nr:hypothetical protein [Nitrospinota bacterium]
MEKRYIAAVAAVFVVWTLMDALIHGVLLMPLYEASQALWRPMGEMIIWLMYLVTFVSAVVFVHIYYSLVAEKSMRNGLTFGGLFGIAWGISMGYGSYSVMPIPYMLALGWFLGTLAESLAAGVIVGYVIRK